MPNPIKTARLRAGLTMQQLADAVGVAVQQINAWESGARSPGPKHTPALAKALDCDEAYIINKAGFLPVTDVSANPDPGFAHQGVTMACEIVRTEKIDGYGVFYIVDHPDVGWMAVLVAGNYVFTTKDWQGQQPRTAAEIENFDWVCGNVPTVMLNGLPRVVPWG